MLAVIRCAVAPEPTKPGLKTAANDIPLSFDYGVALKISKELYCNDLQMLSVADEPTAKSIAIDTLKT